MDSEGPSYYRFSGWLLDVEAHRLVRNGQSEYLSPRIFQTLLTLLRRPGAVIPKDELIARIWEGGAVTDNALTRCIKEVREILGDDAENPRFIETVPRLGYRFIAAVEPAESVPAGTGPVQPKDTSRGAGRTRWMRVGFTVAILAGLALALSLFMSGAPAKAPPNSVAVLPFADLSPSSDTEYFADGVSEEILNALARVGELKVAARTSAFSFKGLQRDVRDIARALSVRHVVEGSVRRSGDRLRVTAQLIEAESGYHVWSQTYDGSLADVVRFQDSVARGVADALGDALGLEGLGAQASVIAPTERVETYETYLLARQIWRQRQPGPISRSIQLFEQVVQADPQFAAGWAALASACLTLSAYTEDAGEAWERSLEAARRALELDSNLAEPYSVLATHAMVARDWVSAAERQHRAVELAPSNPTVRLWYSELLVKLGRVEAAIEQSSLALELDPLYTPALGNAGHQLATAGRLDEAAKELQRAWDLGLHAMFVWVGNFYVAIMQERFEDADRWLAQRPTAQGIEADRALLAALRDRDERDRRDLVEAVDSALDQGMGLREGIMYLAAAGAVDAAFEHLLPAAAANWVQTESLWHPWTAALREDPRFAEAARSLGMVEYWRIHGPPDMCELVGDELHCRGPATAGIHP